MPQHGGNCIKMKDIKSYLFSVKSRFIFLYFIAALNLSKAIEFQDGIFFSLLLKMQALEELGDVRGAFQVAVWLKTVNFKVNLATRDHPFCFKQQFLVFLQYFFQKVRADVARLRDTLGRIFEEVRFYFFTLKIFQYRTIEFGLKVSFL